MVHGRLLPVTIVMPFGQVLGGTDRLLLTLLAHPSEHCLDVSLIVLEDGPLAVEAGRLGVDVEVEEVRRDNHPVDAARLSARLRRRIARARPSAVLSWWPRAHLYVAPAVLSLRSRPRLAWWQHDLPTTSQPLQRAATLLPADLVVCTSAAAQRAQGALWPRRATRVVHPGIDAPGPLAPQDRREAREALGASDDELLVGIVGRLVAWKGQDRFLEAVGRLSGDGLPVRAAVIGDTAYDIEPEFRGQLLAQAQAPGLDGRVTFTGHLEDPLPAIGALDVLVSAAASEPFGMTMVEAMAMGVPVVAVDNAGPREILNGADSGVLVADASPAALADGIRSLAVLTAAERAALGEGARRRYVEHFTAARLARETGALLRELCRGRP